MTKQSPAGACERTRAMIVWRAEKFFHLRALTMDSQE